VLGDLREEDRPVVMRVVFEPDARDVDRDHDVRIRVAVSSVAQRDLVFRIRLGRVGACRGETEHDQHRAERDRRGTHSTRATWRAIPLAARRARLVVVRVVIRVAPYFALQCLQRSQLASFAPQRRPLHAVAPAEYGHGA
jgi:hypothetical protein